MMKYTQVHIQDRTCRAVVAEEEPMAESRRCFGCSHFVASLKTEVRLCKNEDSPYQGTRRMYGCDCWERRKRS